MIKLIPIFYSNALLGIMTKRYKNVSIPEELYEKLDELVKSKKVGYVSVSDAVKDAIRELLKNINYYHK